MMMDDEEMEIRRLFKKLSDSKFLDDLRKFHRLTTEKYGFNYGEADLDEIIDSIDYGSSKMTFARFEQLMKEEAVRREDRKEGD